MALETITLTINQATWNMILQGLGDTFTWNKANPVLVDLIGQVQSQIRAHEVTYNELELPDSPPTEGQ